MWLAAYIGMKNASRKVGNPFLKLCLSFGGRRENLNIDDYYYYFFTPFVTSGTWVGYVCLSSHATFLSACSYSSGSQVGAGTMQAAQSLLPCALLGLLHPARREQATSGVLQETYSGQLEAMFLLCSKICLQKEGLDLIIRSWIVSSSNEHSQQMSFGLSTAELDLCVQPGFPRCAHRGGML